MPNVSTNGPIGIRRPSLSAIIHRRDRQPSRIVISSTRSADVATALDAFLSGSADLRLTVGTAVADELPVAFVYSGNGSQWVGMGRSAYRNSAAFRARFEQVDCYFKEIGGWSLKETLFSDSLHERLTMTSCRPAAHLRDPKRLNGGPAGERYSTGCDVRP